MKPLSQHIQEGLKEESLKTIDEDILDRIAIVNDDEKIKPSAGTDGL